MYESSFFSFYVRFLFPGLFLVFDLQIFSLFFIKNHGFLLSLLAGMNFPFFWFVFFLLSSKLHDDRFFLKGSLFEKFFI